MSGHPLLHLRASFHRVRGIAAFVAVWFAAATAGFRWLGGLDPRDALLSAFYLEVQPGAFSQAYAFWGQSLIFGVLVTVLIRETLENHAERCRLMSGLVKDHTIIVGYTHLGARLVEHCISKKLPYVLIEKDKALVDDLLRRGEPVVIDDARSKDALPAANVAGARRMIIASNNIETSLILTKTAREANPALKIVARCPIDDLVGVLEKLGADHVYSASQAAFNAVLRDFD
ncbi:MAG: NAD(P)-binding protein [Elusimicrobiota bacterium]